MWELAVFCFLNLTYFFQSATLLKRGRWHRCFPVNFTNFLKKTFLYRPPPVAASEDTIRMRKICSNLTIKSAKTLHWPAFFLLSSNNWHWMSLAFRYKTSWTCPRKILRNVFKIAFLSIENFLLLQNAIIFLGSCHCKRKLPSSLQCKY